MSDKVKILIVDADAQSTMYMQMQLEMANYEVLKPAATGKEAIETAKSENPDIVILNIDLPGEISGLETGKEISTTTNTNIIFMAEYQNMGMLEKAKTIKPAWQFIKPFDIGKVKQQIDLLAEVCF